MEEDAFPNWVVIDRDGNAFLAVDYLDKIPTSPSDNTIRERFFNETVEFEVPGPASVCLGPQIFVSLNTLNMLLASATKPLHARIITEVTGDGYNRISLRLEDSDGNEVSFSDQAHDGLGDLQALVKDEEGQLEIDTPELLGGDRVDRHGTPCENAGRVGDGQAQQKDGSEHHVGSHANVVSPDNTHHVEDSGVDTTPVTPGKQDGGILDATPLRPRDHLVADDNPDGLPPHQHGGGRPYDRALVKQLRDFKLTDNATLSALLHDRLPPALNKLKQVQDDLVHLATLSNGQVCSVRIFRDLCARREDLSFPSLADPNLLHRPVTTYQKLELLRILQDALRSPSAQADDVVWPPPSHPASLPSMRQNLLGRSYQDAAQFERNLELLATYPGGGRGAAAARRLVVDEIRTMMRARCAIGPLDVLDPLFNGLLREVVIHAAAGAKQPVRFVLPLGRLYRAGADADARPRPLDCFVLLDVASPRKPLWLLRRNGEGCCDLVALAEDISFWRLGSRDDNRDGGLVRRGPAGGEQEPSEGERALLRAKLMTEYPESVVRLGPDAVRFRRVDRRRAAEAIRRGWGVVGSSDGSPERAWVQRDSPLRRALLNSAATRAQESPLRKRGRKEDTGEPDGDEENDGSDEEWTPASERMRAKKTGGERRNAVRRSC